MSFLRSHTRNKIVELQICGNPITDTSPLCSGLVFDNSRSVSVSAGRLGTVDLSFLGDIDVFDLIRLDGTDCTQLWRNVSGKQILWLVVDHSGLRDIRWLETVRSTWNFDISGNPSIRDLSALKKMESLQTVTVSKDMRPLTEAVAADVRFSFRFV